MPSLIRPAIVLGALALAVTSASMACGDRIDTGLVLDSTVYSVTLFPPGPVNMNIGTKVTFSASVDAGAGLTDRRVAWSSANTRVATVDQNGIVTADSVGTTTIIATSIANTAIFGAAVVTIGLPVPATRIP